MKYITTIVLNWLSSPAAVWHYRRIWLDALALTLVATASVWLISNANGLSAFQIFDENAPHEMLQSVFLGLAVVLAAIAAWRAEPFGRYLAISIALICYIFLFRETPVCKDEIVSLCTSRPPRVLSIAGAAVALLICTVFYEFRHRGIVLKALHPALSWPLAVTAFALFGSQVMEHLHFMAVEETLELYAYAILLLASLWFARHSSHYR